jgi:tetratricopeptide (TPR) repeat protein
MARILVLTAALAALAITPAFAASKPPVKPKPGQLTTTDLRTCMGLNNAKPEEQIPACTKIIKSGSVKRPYEGDYYATRGAAYLALGQLNEALADLNKAIGIRPAAEFYFQRGLIHLGRTEQEEAKGDFDQTIKLKPTFGPSYMMRGLIAYRSGDFGEAQTLFDNAVKRQPNYFQAIYARGVAKKRNGDEAGGAKDIAAARSISSRADEDAKKLGLVL